MATRSDISVFYNLSPRLIKIDAPSTELTIQDLHDTVRDIEDEPANLIYPDLISSAGKETLGGGIFVGLTATLQNAQVMFERRTNLLESGTITTASGSEERAITLIDSAATFITNGVKRDDWVVNQTDNSYGEVLSVDSETQLTVARPTNGTDNLYQFGDSYEVYEMVQCEVSGGNLVAVDEIGDPIDAIFPTVGTQVVRTSASSATLQEQADIQYASFNGGVTIDVVNGVSGILFPTGTPRQPVDNLSDALTILTARGFDRFYVRGDLTVDAGTLPYLFVGQGVSVTTLTLNSAPNLTNARFQDATITGTLDGDASATDCVIDTLNFFNGTINSCVLTGTITLGGGIEALILDSFSDSGGAVIDFGGSGQSLDLQNFNGALTLQNKTGSDVATVGLGSGEITLDNTVTSGDVTLSGVGRWLNRDTYSGGATITNELIDALDIQQSSFEGQIVVDAINGVSGTVYPRGTAGLPVDNIPDAVSIADTVGLNKLKIIGDITLDTGDSLTGFLIFGQNIALSTITINPGAVTTDCEFQECTLTGTLDGNSIIRNSKVTNITIFNGVLLNSMITGTVTLGGGLEGNILDCYSGVPGAATPVIDFGGSGQALLMRNYAGGIRFINKTGTEACSIDLNSGQIIVDNTVTSGTLTLRGIGKWTNETTYAGGATINNELLSTGTIVEAFDNNTYDGVALTDILQDLLAMANGRIVESPANTFTFYERDNTTVRFVLTKAGSERTRS